MKNTVQSILASLMVLSLGACELATTTPVQSRRNNDGGPKAPVVPPVVPPVVREAYACYTWEAANVVNQGQTQVSLDLKEKLSSSQAEDRVITGLGFDLDAQGIKGVSVVSRIMDRETGEVLENSALESVEGSLGSNERFIEAPEGFYIYGFGVVSYGSASSVFGVKIYVARANLENNTYETQECVVTAAESSCGTVPTVFSPATQARYKEFKASPQSPLTAVGASVNGNITGLLEAASSALKVSECYR